MFIDRQLSNGVRVIAQRQTDFRSVAMGVWVRTGSVLEPPQLSGISHFIEHMLFKGTERRSALDISTEIDGIGGQINAFTSKECTCFYVKVMDEHVAVGVDVLADMLQNSLLDPGEIAKEQGVVVEEIGMSFDNPEDYVHELLAGEYFQGHPLGRPILGTRETVKGLDRAALTAYMGTHYTAANTVIAVAGNFQEEDLLALLEAAFGSLVTGGEHQLPPEYLPTDGSIAIDRRDIAQVHVALALPGLPMEHPRQYDLFILNAAFGGSMSSRLFQTIREQHGLAYSVFSYPSFYRNTGSFSVYLGTSPDQAMQALELVAGEFKRLLTQGVTTEEFERCRRQLRGNYILGQESTSSRMMALGKGMTLVGHVQTPDEILAKMDAASVAVAMDTVRELFDMNKLSIAMVGAAPDAADVQALFA